MTYNNENVEPWGPSHREDGVSHREDGTVHDRLVFAVGTLVRGGGFRRYLLEWVPKDLPHVDDFACLRQSNDDFAAMRFFPPDLTHWPLQ